MISPGHIEGIARDLLERTGVTPPIDAFELADLCGFTCRPWGRGGGQIDLARKLIRFPAKARSVHQHGVVAHEVFHFALERAGVQVSNDDEGEEREAIEGAARYGAGCLLVPRDALLADVRAVGLDLFALGKRHPNASMQMLSIRLCQVILDTWSEVWDQGKRSGGYGSHAIETRDLVDQVLATGEPVRGDGVGAWPVFDGSYRRVIVLGRVA